MFICWCRYRIILLCSFVGVDIGQFCYVHFFGVDIGQFCYVHLLV